MKKLMLIPLLLVIGLTIVAPCVYAMKIKFAYVFIDRFPNQAQSLGFPAGDVLHLGAFIIPGDTPIKEVTAKNLDNGLDLKLTQLDVGSIYSDLLYEAIPYLPFDPEKHKGVWEIKIKDEQGNEVVANTHRLDKVAQMPYVSNIKASGNPLAPMITWSAPERDSPAYCKIKYIVRLLKDKHSQFYKSKKGLLDTKEQIPDGLLKAEDIPDTYVRIECQCWDTDEEDSSIPLELKSQTFRPLKEALGQ